MNGIRVIYSRSKWETIIKGLITIWKDIINWLQKIIIEEDSSVIKITNSSGLNISVIVKH